MVSTQQDDPLELPPYPGGGGGSFSNFSPYSKKLLSKSEICNSHFEVNIRYVSPMLYFIICFSISCCFGCLFVCKTGRPGFI
jgi:hypothetical protein